MTPETEKQLIDDSAASAGAIAVAIATALGTPIAGTIVAAIVVGVAKLLELGITPDQVLLDLSTEHARRLALVDAARGEADADEDKKFGGQPVRIEPTNDGSDVYGPLDDALPPTQPEPK